MASLSLVITAAFGCSRSDPDTGKHVEPSVAEFGNALTACGLDPSRYWDYGCFCGLGGAGTPVDGADECCKTHDDAYDGAPTGCDCLTQSYTLNLGSGGCGGLSCPDNGEDGKMQTECQLYCCQADIKAAQCLRASPYDPKYYDWSDRGNPGASCSSTHGKTYNCDSGYIPSTATCSQGTKTQGLLGWFCRASCTKPQTCETSNTAPNYYARCKNP